MRIRYSRVLMFKISLLLLIILLGGLAFSGCTSGVATVPKGWSGGVIANSTLFIGSMEGKLVAANTTDGSRLWAMPLENPRSGGGGFGCAAPVSTVVAIYGSPAVTGDLVYVGGYNGKIYAVNSRSGALRWVYPRQDYLKPIVGGPVVALGKVYFGSADGKVYALDTETGDDKIWAKPFETGDKIWSSPAIDGNTIYIGSFDKKLYAIDTITGNKKWEFKTGGAIVSTPVIYDNTVYFGSFDRYLYAIDATDGSLKWKSMAENWFWAKPVIYDGAVYAASLDGKAYVLDAQSGNKLDEFNLGSPQNPISASPVLVGNSVIVATEDGVVYALDAGSKKDKELKYLGEKVQAPLATDGTVVYIHTSTGKLYALNAQSGAELWSPLSLKSIPSPSTSTPSPSSGTNWGLLISMTVAGIVLVMVFRLLGRSRKV